MVFPVLSQLKQIKVFREASVIHHFVVMEWSVSIQNLVIETVQCQYKTATTEKNLDATDMTRGLKLWK